MACQTTPTAREIAEHVGRPNFPPPCINNDDGTCYREGELESSVNSLCDNTDTYIDAQDYIEDIEHRLYVCLKFPRRCK